MSEQQEILELLAKGKISADEAAELLGNLSEKAKQSEPAPEKEPEPVAAEKSTTPSKEFSEKQPSWFKVRVRNLETGKNKVTVNIPLRMVDFGLKLGRRFAPELDGLDYGDLTGMMKSMDGAGVLVEVEDEESNEHVQVFVE
jgi:polyhydroxyalkanoate synthesis regulator phasin